MIFLIKGLSGYGKITNHFRVIRALPASQTCSTSVFCLFARFLTSLGDPPNMALQ